MKSLRYFAWWVTFYGVWFVSLELVAIMRSKGDLVGALISSGIAWAMMTGLVFLIIEAKSDDWLG